MNLKPGDIFYSVMQKDNNPFEKPRICKFIVKYIKPEERYSIVSTKQDRYFRNWVFRPDQVYETYGLAVPERNQKIEKLKEVEAISRAHTEERLRIQKENELQRQREYDNQIRNNLKQELKKQFEFYINYFSYDWGNQKLFIPEKFNEILNKLLGENNDTREKSSK